jgi:hypothetical protein
MAIEEQDMTFLMSAQSPSIGGAITLNPVPQGVNSFFGDVDFAEATTGSTHYRCFYVKNNSTEDILFSAGIYISVRTPNPSTLCELGLGAAGMNVTEPAIADQTVPPDGVEFFATRIDQQLLLGNMDAGDYHAVWIKRVVSPEAAGAAADRVVLTLTGDRGALLE